MPRSIAPRPRLSFTQVSDSIPRAEDQSAPTRWLPLAVAAIAGVVYALTAARDVVVGDSGEFLAAAARLGVAHPPGYPLLVLLGHAFSWLPIGPLPFRINFLAAVCGAAAVGFVCATAQRLGASRTGAIVASLVLAFNPLFWEWSLAIEAFPLNNVLAAALIYWLVRWNAEPAKTGFLIAAALTGGLATSNHLTIVFLIPFVAIVMWRNRRSIRIPTLLACAGSVFIGLLPYLYIPWAAARHPLVNWGSISSASGLLHHFLRSDYGTGRLVAAGAPSGDPVERLVAFGASFTVLETLLVVTGLARAWRSGRWYFWATSGSALLAGPLFAAYANIDVGNLPLLWALRRFFLLPHVILAPLAAIGFTWLAELIVSRTERERQRAAVLSLAGVALAVVVVSAGLRYPSIDQHDNHVARFFAEDILNSSPPRSVLLGLGDETVFPVAYVQSAEQQRPDVTLIMLGLFRSFEWYVAQLRQRDPDLVIPFTRYDPTNAGSTLRALVDANPGRVFEIVGAPTDRSLDGAYWMYRRGLVEEIEPMSKDIGLDAATSENDRLLASYRLPDTSRIRRNTFEIAILAKYTRGPAAMGDQFALMHLDRQAETWYRRALAIDPEASDVKDALFKISNKAAR